MTNGEGGEQGRLSRWRLSRAKVAHWLRIYADEWVSQVVLPFGERDTTLAVLAAPMTLLLVLLVQGLDDAKQEYSSMWIAAQAYTFALLAHAVLASFIRVPFATTRRSRVLGAWHSNAFVYRRPDIVATIVASESEPTATSVQFSGAPPCSLVKYIIETEGHIERVQATFGPGVNPWTPEYVKWKPGGGQIRVDRRSFALLEHSVMPQSVPVILRVYMTAWSVGDDGPF